VGASGRRTVTSTFVLAALALTAVVGFGASMAFAAGGTAISNPSTLTCTPTSVTLHKSCRLNFTDEHEPRGYGGGSRAGQRVCFSTAAPNTVRGRKTAKCSVTNTKGIAYGTFTGNKLGTAKVYATETTEGGVSEGKVLRTITVVR
jgi:hypothetical protein